MFENFWSAYDKKVDRPATLKAWNRAKIDFEALQSVLKAVAAYVVATPDKKYRKNPATWLNGRCWNDEIVFEQQTKSSETEYQRSMRLKMQQVCPDIAAKPPDEPYQSAADFFRTVDVQAVEIKSIGGVV